MSKYKTLGKNTILVFIGSFGSKLITFFMLPLYTSWLSVIDYGTVDLLNVYVSFLIGFVTASLSESVFIFSKNQTKEKQKEYFSSGLFVAGCFLVISAIIFKIISFFLEKNGIENVFTKNIWVIYALIISKFLLNYVQQFIKGLNKMKLFSSVGIVLTISTAAFSFLFIPNHGVYGYVASIICAHLVSLVYTVIVSKAYTFLSVLVVSKKSYKPMLIYSLPLIPNALMWWFIGYFNRPLLEEYAGLEVIGLFAVANKFPTILVMIFSVFFSSWQVSVLEEFHKENYSLFYNKVLKILLFILSLSSILLIIFSELIVSFMLDNEYYNSWFYIPLLAIVPLFHAISSFSAVNFNATKKTKYIFYGSMIGAGVSVISNFILIPIFNIWGAIYSIIISYIVMATFRVIFAWQFVKITNIISNSISLIIPVLVSFIVLFFENQLYKYIFSTLLMLLFLLVNREYLMYLKKINKKWKI